MTQVKADQDPASPRFLWLHPKTERFPGSWPDDPELGRAISDHDFLGADFAEGELEAWTARLGWAPGAHWLLLSPQGEPLLSGAAPPEAAALLDAMRAAGWTPRSERLSQFLREHPEDGEAWAELVDDEAGFARRQASLARRLAGVKPPSVEEMLNPPPLGAAADQARWGATVEALNGFLDTEGWTGHRRLPEILVDLDVSGARGSTLLKDPLQRMRRGVEDALARDPGSVDLWVLWSFLAGLAPGGNAENLLQGIDAVPRAPWPPTAAADLLGEALDRAKRWEELEALASRAYAQGTDPRLLPYLGDQARRSLILRWGFWRVLALLRMDRREEADAVIKDMRAQDGAQWPDDASRGLADSLGYYLGPDDPIIPKLKAAKQDPAPPDPSRPGFPLPLHLALAGHPSWEQAWLRFPGLSVFDPWEPGEELGWQPLKPAEEAALRARMQWGTEGHWVLLRGTEVLASGADLPKPASLADRLRAEGAPYLAQLDAFVRTHPDRLDGRAARLEELRGRMPNERLEGGLLEDARVCLSPFQPGEGTPMNGTDDWTPRKALWAPAAPKASAELEARIRRWPGREALWQAWFDWNAVAERPADPVRFAEDLAVWKARFDSGAGPLPDGVMAVGIQSLMEAGRFEALAGWCRFFWEGGVRDLLARQGKAGEAEHVLPFTYAMALRKLGRTAQLHGLTEEIRTFDPRLASALTASSRPLLPGR